MVDLLPVSPWLKIGHLRLCIEADFGSRLLESQVATKVEVAVEDLACTIFKYYNRSSPLIQEVDDNLGRFIGTVVSLFLDTNHMHDAGLQAVCQSIAAFKSSLDRVIPSINADSALSEAEKAAHRHTFFEVWIADVTRPLTAVVQNQYPSDWEKCVTLVLRLLCEVCMDLRDYESAACFSAGGRRPRRTSM